MTTTAQDPPGSVIPAPTYPNPSLPARWQGGTFVLDEPTLIPDAHDEAKHAPPEQLALNTDWRALEDLTEGDPPEVWGLDPASASAGPGSGRGPRRLQTLTGVVRRISATGSGVLLEEQPSEWLNVSRFRPVDLTPYDAGDVVEVVVELGTNGKKYVHGIRRVEGAVA